MADKPIIYGVPFSQPVRAVMWLLLYKQQPFDMVLINPGSSGDNGSRNPKYLAKNPGGTIPCLEEPDTGFCLAEAHAIMPYLCQTHGWTDLYPDDLRQRAMVDWYLHYHHKNIREASGLVAPKIRKDLDIPELLQKASFNNLTNALKSLDGGWLAEHDFIAGSHLTIADLAAYVEIGQCQSCFTNVYDFEPFPNVVAWLQRMQQVDGHDDVHVVLSVLGDISQQAPDMDTIKQANKSALSTLKRRLAEIEGVA